MLLHAAQKVRSRVHGHGKVLATSAASPEGMMLLCRALQHVEVSLL